MKSRRNLIVSACTATVGSLAGCLSSQEREHWVVFAGFIVANMTDSSHRCRLGVTDSGTPIPYSTTVDVPPQSREPVEQAAAEAPEDYLLGAKVDESTVTVNTRDFVSADADAAVATVTIEESTELTISGRGYDQVPNDLSESTTET